MVDLNFEGVYSPQSCDIWSLGIILLNMVTGRNPWKCASQEDPTFRSYFRNPYRFLSKILPISLELNDVLVMMLSVEWRARSSISEIRAAVSQLETFYSTDAVFEGNLAKCPWETGVDLGTSNKPDSRIDISPPGEETDRNVTPSRSPTIGKDNIPLQPSSDPLSWWEDEDDTDDGWAPVPSPSPPISQSETSSCNSDPSSPLTPSSTRSPSTSRSRPSTNSFISSLQSFFRLCSSPSLLREEKEYLTLDPEAYTIDL